MGLCQWSLDTMNNRFLVMNMSLPIERSIVGTNHGCGWIIGKGSNTVYYSIEEEEEEQNRKMFCKILKKLRERKMRVF